MKINPRIGRLSLLATLIIGAAALTGATAGPARSGGPTVSVVDYSFDPPTITVDAGTTITWTVTKAADPHTVSPVEPADAFTGSGLLREGDRFSVTFTVPGTYRYQCLVHPEQMRGTVIVVAVAPSPSPSPNPTASLTGTPAPSPSFGPAPTPAPSGGGGAFPDGTVIAALVAVVAAAGLAAAWLVVPRRGRSRS